MAKHYKKKKHHVFRTLLIIFLCLTVVGVSAFFVGRKLYFPKKYSENVTQAEEKYDLDEDLIYAVIRTESRFDSDAESSAGAVGLMQLTPETYKWICSKRDISFNADDLKKPAVNIDFGCWYLRFLIDLFEDEKVAVAAYNAGQNKVFSWLENEEYSSDGKTLKKIPYKETEKYVDSVFSAREMYKKLYFR